MSQAYYEEVQEAPLIEGLFQTLKLFKKRFVGLIHKQQEERHWPKNNLKPCNLFVDE